MTQPAKTQEPSMEEILASIRRIIADDPPKTARQEATRGPALRTEKPQANDAFFRDRTNLPGSREDPTRSLPPREERSPLFAPPFSAGRAGENKDSSQPPSRSASFLAAVIAAPQPAISPASEQPSSAPADEVSPQADIDAMLAELNARTRAAAREPEETEPEEPAADILELTEEIAPQEVPTNVVSLDAALENAERTAETMAVAAALDLADQEAEEEEPEEISQATPARVEAQTQSYVPEHETEPAPGVDGQTIDGNEMDDGLISAATTAAVDSAFNALAQTVLVQNARTLEDLVREMLRPMLKIWLDDNLPGLVERLVRAEIERVSRGRG